MLPRSHSAFIIIDKSSLTKVEERKAASGCVEAVSRLSVTVAACHEDIRLKI